MSAEQPYAVVASRVSALISDAVARDGEPAVAQRPVPACPQWTVRETLAHLVGVPADILAGNLERAGRDDWTAEQVVARAGASLSDLLGEWAGTAPRVAVALAGLGPAGGQPVFDAVTHELDLRAALGVDPVEPDDVLGTALDWLLPNFGRAVVRRGSPALRIVGGSREWVVGDGAPAGTLTGSDRDVLRSISGRRTRAQVQALLDADLEPWWPAFRWGPFTPPEHPVDARP